jgi:hypothetical protein
MILSGCFHLVVSGRLVFTRVYVGIYAQALARVELALLCGRGPRDFDGLRRREADPVAAPPRALKAPHDGIA